MCVRICTFSTTAKSAILCLYLYVPMFDYVLVQLYSSVLRSLKLTQFVCSSMTVPHYLFNDLFSSLLKPIVNWKGLFHFLKCLNIFSFVICRWRTPFPLLLLEVP